MLTSISHDAFKLSHLPLLVILPRLFLVVVVRVRVHFLARVILLRDFPLVLQRNLSLHRLPRVLFLDHHFLLLFVFLVVVAAVHHVSRRRLCLRVRVSLRFRNEHRFEHFFWRTTTTARRTRRKTRRTRRRRVVIVIIRFVLLLLLLVFLFRFLLFFDASYSF